MNNYPSSNAFDDDDEAALAFNIREGCGEHARFREGMELDDEELEQIGDYYAEAGDEPS